MPTPQKPITVGAKSSTLAVSTEKIYATFVNLTSGDKVTQEFDTNGECVINEPPTAWKEGDLISVQVYGKYNTASSATVTKGGISVNLGSLSEDTATSDVNL